jgi:hypothetical protein
MPGVNDIPKVSWKQMSLLIGARCRRRVGGGSSIPGLGLATALVAARKNAHSKAQ